MTPRLYTDQGLVAGDAVALSPEQAHYLKNVLRRETGDEIVLFNGRDGEFLARLTELKKKAAIAVLDHQTRPQVSELDLELYLAPVKRAPLETIVQKAVELGATKLTPVLTQRTVATRMNVDRLRAIAIEAAEQCGRLGVPDLHEPKKLSAVLNDWPAGRRLMFCDEAGDDTSQEWGGPEGRAMPVLDALTPCKGQSEKWAILIGPEGGFTADERAVLRAKSFVTPVTLGPRILRADTAAIAALTLWQAVLGDWQR